MLGHSMGTLRTFLQTSAQSAEAFRGGGGSGGCSPRNFTASQVSSEADSRTVSVAPDLRSTTILSAPIIRLLTCTGGAQPLVARARAPVCPSLATPLNVDTVG